MILLVLGGAALEGSSAISPVLRVRMRTCRFAVAVAVIAVVVIEHRGPRLSQPPEVLLDGPFDILAMGLFQGAAVQPRRLLSVAVTLDFACRAGAAKGTGLVAFLVADPTRPAALRAATHLAGQAHCHSFIHSLTSLISLDHTK